MKHLLTLLFCLTTLTATAQQRHGDGLDDLLQHVPMASVFVLKACEFDNQTPWAELALTAVASYTIATTTTYSLKQIVSERRPDKSDRRSFPSGHATYAFAGATMLTHEFGHLTPWVPIAGYGLAAVTAIDRVRRDRHYLHDVCAGAAVGIAATELTYWLKHRLVKSRNLDLGFTGQQLYLALRW